MKDFAKVTLRGEAGVTTPLRYTSKGEPTVFLSVATSSRGADGVRVAHHHRVRLSGELAEVAHKHVKRGTIVLIEGALTHSGSGRCAEIVAETMLIQGKA